MRGVKSARGGENGASELSDLIVKDGRTSAPSVIPTLASVFHLVPTCFSDNHDAGHNSIGVLQGRQNENSLNGKKYRRNRKAERRNKRGDGVSCCDWGEMRSMFTF